MDAYLDAKTRLFQDHLRESTEGGWAVLNAQDPASSVIEKRCRGRVIRYGDAPESHFRAVRWSLDLDGTRMSIRHPGGDLEITTPLVGQPNVLNALAACACAWALGVPPDRWAEGLRALGRVSGRLERVEPSSSAGDRGIAVLVDYAHTPDALDRSLASARSLTQGRLICVFGCGGDRDRGKRPLMAQAAARHCDLAVVTSDNPRRESPGAIIEEVVVGFRGLPIHRVSLVQGECPDRFPVYAVIEDRREAIRNAIACASPGDLVVISGKGHETYQILGSQTVSFDDREVARQAMEEVRK
jgi:UDP-N-acetylmuramyl-tripeptide synthetase